MAENIVALFEKYAVPKPRVVARPVGGNASSTAAADSLQQAALREEYIEQQRREQLLQLHKSQGSAEDESESTTLRQMDMQREHQQKLGR